MSTQVAAALGRLRSMLAAEAVTYRLATLTAACKANFNPSQPRVPAGNPDGGQWTGGGGGGSSGSGGVGRTGGGINDPRVLSDAPSDDDELKPGAQLASLTPRGPRGPSTVPPMRINNRWVQPTLAEHLRFNEVSREADAAIARVHRLDPNWQRPSSGLAETVRGRIAEEEAVARAAEARYETLRSGIGGNYGPPLTPAAPSGAGVPPSPQRFEGQAWIDAYRTVHVRRDLFGNQIPLLTNDDTVAVAELDSEPVFGVNSRAATFTDSDAIESRRYVDILVKKYPETMSTDNLGQFPNNAMSHAETNLLTRAAGARGGTLNGRDIKVQVDRDLCPSCMSVLPKLGLELGNPNMTYIDPNYIYVFRDGALISRRRR